MEHKKHNESQELSVQELADISGGVAVSEYYPTEYPTDSLYDNVSEEITKKLENAKSPYWKDKYSNYQNDSSDSSS